MIRTNKHGLIIAFFALLVSPVVSQNETNRPFFRSPDGIKWVSTDLHIHTVFSDGSVWPNIRVEEARREGLDLIAMTEHLEYQPHSQDIPHPDRNRSYILAKDALRNGEVLQVINGAEITRSMPPGHINAVFVKDANALLHKKDSLKGIEAANTQGAFVFWNHPNWTAQRTNGIARLDPFHHYLIDNKLLHGIEVVNETTFSEEALQIALDKNLTVLGTSDIHGLVDWAHGIAKGGHRPMTFVMVVSQTVDAVKEALFEGKTFVWYEDMLIGKEEILKTLVRANLSFTALGYPKGSDVLNIAITNHSALPYTLYHDGIYSFHTKGQLVEVPAYQTVELQVKTKAQISSMELNFKVLNAIIAPKSPLVLTWPIQVP